MALSLAKAQKHGCMAKTKIAKLNVMLYNGANGQTLQKAVAPR
tara:strand:- start:462 stop:590 length:129 start_codon:yes stop_codon:yes gene_type:complete